MAHASNSTAMMMTEIREHVPAQGIVIGVRAIVNHRYEAATKKWQLFVAWRGLEDAKNSREPFAALQKDVQALVAQNVESTNDAELAALLYAAQSPQPFNFNVNDVAGLHTPATSTLVRHALMDTFRWTTCSVVTIHSRKHYYWQKATDICQ
ncbi:unnamed protein product [Phytophthora fragariaefolia]|uniref:Unnamed protein product n=1 Tax=Phytophthora fragariaefolia TaxID=1490495 RepID=A0A9W7D5K4_9STRA|nr:unnamed protein product [Phytophthora fragariaefolia]